MNIASGRPNRSRSIPSTISGAIAQTSMLSAPTANPPAADIAIIASGEADLIAPPASTAIKTEYAIMQAAGLPSLRPTNVQIGIARIWPAVKARNSGLAQL